MKRAFTIVAALVLLLGLDFAGAQSRMNDKDVENTMKNLNEDAKKFRSSFNGAIGKSTIRKTSQEKEAKALVETFTKDIQRMLEQFKKNKKADSQLRTVVNESGQIDRIMQNVTLSGNAPADWSKVKAEVDILAREFNVDSQLGTVR